MEADSEASFATADGRIVGTVNYMSPEQATALSIDGRSDLFSLGCTMYQLLTGRLPFPGESIAECLVLRIKGQSTPITDFRPDLSPRLIEVLAKLMARRPEDRYQTAAEAAVRYRPWRTMTPAPLPLSNRRRSRTPTDRTLSPPRRRNCLRAPGSPPRRPGIPWSRRP